VLLSLQLVLPSTVRAQQPRLTEFLAVNTNGITDEDLSRQGWIEIWNPSLTAVFSLAGYKLSSNPPSPGVATIWTIPTIQIMPDERILIWASGKNRTVVTAPLHASFTLPAASGSSLSLLNSGNTVVSTISNYPGQAANVSWGRDDSDIAIAPAVVGFYTRPTPGEKNNRYTGAGVAGGVVFSEASRAFNTSPADTLVNLSLAQAVPDPAAQILYTTGFSNLNSVRQQHTATALPGGGILLTGGLSSVLLASSEIFNPAATNSLPAASLATARRLHTATALSNGKVLVVGGFGSSGALSTAELYDPATNAWSAAGLLATARQLHTATLLPDGKVLVAGGLGAAALSTSELYNPASNTWTASGSLASARQLHTASLLSSGKVLVTGGLDAGILNSSEIYDPATGLWTGAAPLITLRQQHTATVLTDGKVLVTGGLTSIPGPVFSNLASAELYDPATNAWTGAGAFTAARRLHTATRLPGGKVLVAGGTSSITAVPSPALNSAQLYDPLSNTWATAGSLGGIRAYHTANLLNNGRVLAAGGANGSTSLATAELYNPNTNAAWTTSPKSVVDIPDINALPYLAPLVINSTQMVRARVFKPGLLPGPTNTQCFLKLETNARTFSSAMPIVVISSFGGTPPDDADLGSFMWVWEPAAPDNRARFTNPPVIASRSVIDKRGSSTLGNPKFSLNVETRKPSDEDEQDFSLLGMPSHSDWVFHAPYAFDRSLLHNPLMYALSNSVGRYAVRNRMAEVFVDVTSAGLSFAGNASGDYFGVYNVMEKIRRGSERVDITRLDTYDNDAARNSGGYIFKIDRLDAGDTGFSAGGQSFAYYYPKERDLKSPQRDPQEKALTAYLNDLNTRLQSATNWKDPVLGYAPKLDVPAAIDHHLLNVWAFNVDALRLSGYWTKDRSGKVFPGPIWDFDRTLSSTDGRDANPLTWRSTVPDLGTDFFNYPWWNRLFLDPDFYQKYIDRWQELRAGPLGRPALEAQIDSLNAQITSEAITRDLARWGQAKRSWTRPFPAPENNTMAASQAAEVQRLKDYMRQRAGFIDSQWVGPVTASVPTGFLAAGSTVTLTGPAGVPVYYTLDGSDPRPSGGAAPGAGPMLYTVPVAITTNTRLRARAYDSTNKTALKPSIKTGANNPALASQWGGPVDVSYTTESPASPGDLILSEINYHPANPTPAELAINPLWTDEDFEFLEISNISGRIINLTGASFSRGVTYSFSGGAARSMGIGESVIIASNPAAFAARYGNALAVSGPWVGDLANSAENITLLSAASAIIFSVDYVDSWVPASDGNGPTLVAYESYPLDFNAAAAWRASSSLGGSPGAWDAASVPVSAGPDISATMDTTLQLRGGIMGSTAPGTPVLVWSKISGPGTLTFTTPAQPITAATASLPGTYQVRLALTVNAITSYDETTIQLVDTMAAWLTRYPTVGGPTDDSDKDGRSNFLEFALFTNPSAATGSEPPLAAVLGNRMTITYQRHKPAAGVTYRVEISDGLNSFRLPTPGELSETLLADDGATETVRVTDTAPLGTPVRRFLRVKVTSP